MFDRALAEAGIDRARVYVTNAVKHFKFELRGKRRIHSKPDAGEIEACRWWIDQERALVKPKSDGGAGRDRGARAVRQDGDDHPRSAGARSALPDGGGAWITVHPSYLLRLDDAAQAQEEYARFVDDLRASVEDRSSPR